MLWATVKAHRELAFRLLSVVGAFASIASLALQYAPPSGEWGTWVTVRLTVGAILLVVFVWLESTSVSSFHVYRIGDHNGIREYMEQWLREGRRVAIWSRDLSWVDDGVRELLRRKAGRGELILCVPARTMLTRELREVGAEVYEYGTIAGVPASRFTIADFERDGARVAVGSRRGNLHVIEEFSAGQDPAFEMANDLVRMARARAEG